VNPIGYDAEFLENGVTIDLMSIGLVVLYAKHLLPDRQKTAENPWFRYLPVASAGAGLRMVVALPALAMRNAARVAATDTSSWPSTICAVSIGSRAAAMSLPSSTAFAPATMTIWFSPALSTRTKAVPVGTASWRVTERASMPSPRHNASAALPRFFFRHQAALNRVGVSFFDPGQTAKTVDVTVNGDGAGTPWGP